MHAWSCPAPPPPRSATQPPSLSPTLPTRRPAAAPQSVLLSGKPHLGTDRLVTILKGLRAHLLSLGADVRFGTGVADLMTEGGRVTGVVLAGVCLGGERGWGVVTGAASFVCPRTHPPTNPPTRPPSPPAHPHPPNLHPQTAASCARARWFWRWATLLATCTPACCATTWRSPPRPLPWGSGARACR